MAQSGAKHPIAMGFWLPCGQSSFFHHRQDERLRAYDHLHDPHLRKLCLDPATQKPNLQVSVYRRLVSVLSSGKYPEYQLVSPVYSNKEEGFDDLHDPIGIVCTAQTLSQEDWEEGLKYSLVAAIVNHLAHQQTEVTQHDAESHRLLAMSLREIAGDQHLESTSALIQHYLKKTEEEEIAQLKEHFHGLILTVNANGYYIWLGIVDDLAHSSSMRHCIQHALRKHILRLVGSAYFSHYSGVDDEPGIIPPAESEQSLIDYRDTIQGILTFTQLNTILEGLYNYTFDPRVFFYSTASQNDETAPAPESPMDLKDETDPEKVKREYTLGAFIEAIVVPTQVSLTAQLHQPDAPARQTPQPDGSHPAQPEEAHAPEGGTEHTNTPKALTLEGVEEIVRHADPLLSAAGLSHDDHQKKHARHAHKNDAHELFHNTMKDAIQAHLLYQFIRVTGSETLQTLKWRIERCRRSLLYRMMGITHRQEPLVQVESPDEGDRIPGVQEAQLRGYVMLFAAKYPLLSNVRWYLSACVDSLHEQATRHLKEYYSNWNALLKNIQEDIQGLERAMEQTNEEELLIEEERIRSQQETFAEIQRLRERIDSTPSPERSTIVSFISNAFSLTSVLLALLSVVYYIFQSASASRGLLISPILVLLLALVILVPLLLGAYIFQRWLSNLANTILMRDAKHVHERHHKTWNYYEMDINLEAPLDQETAVALIDDAQSAAAWAPVRDAKDERILGDVRKASYRISRSSRDEAVHKVSLEVPIARAAVSDLAQAAPNGARPQSHEGAKAKKDPFIKLYLVYEVLFHRPSNVPSYALQNVRAVVIEDDSLSMRQLDQIKGIVVDVFINPWISRRFPHNKIERGDIGQGMRRDAFLMPNFVQVAVPASPTAPATETSEARDAAPVLR